MLIQDEIRWKYPGFSPKEKKIADYIMANDETLENINISDLAKVTETSPSTITRFVKTLGLESFVELKIKLNGKNTEKKKRPTNSTTESLVFEYYQKVIHKTEEISDFKNLKKVVDLIKTANRIYLFGVGSSGLTAGEFTQRLVRMGLNAMTTSDSHMMIINSSILKRNDLVIGISASGETKEVLDAVTLAKMNHAYVVGMTSFPESQLAKMADLTLDTYSSKFIDNQRFINSQFSIMYQIDVLSTLLLEDPELNDKMSRTISVILKENHEQS